MDKAALSFDIHLYNLKQKRCFIEPIDHSLYSDGDVGGVGVCSNIVV